MRRAIFLGVALVLATILAGCGGGDSRRTTTVTTQIFSDPRVDGYIAEDLASAVLSAPVPASRGGVGFIRVGINPTLGAAGTEYRGFLHFPLEGSGGVPVSATIVSATVEIFINSVQFASTVPIRTDLISFTPPLIGSDYDVVLQPPLLTRSTFNILSGDAGSLVGVLINVTSLMEEAQRQRLPYLQLRFFLPFTPPGASGLTEIDDRLTVGDTAPLLTVEYR
jgi:hypothetical protein